MDFHLTAADLRTPLWRRLEKAMRAELQALRERNDALHLAPETTTEIRTRIAGLKEMLSLADNASDSSDGHLVRFDEETTFPLEDVRKD